LQFWVLSRSANFTAKLGAMPPISLKALIVSNVCDWLFVAFGMITLMVVYYAGLTVASDGAANSHAILEQMRASSTLLIFTAFTTIVAAGLAAYIGARMAPEAKILNGTLAISLWLLFDVCTNIKGGGGSSKVHIPLVLDFLTSYGIVVPALAGAYLGSLRANADPLGGQIRTAPEISEPRAATLAPVAGSASSQTKRRLSYGGTGLGTFIFIASQFLLNKHEQNILFIGLLAVIAVMVAAAFAVKMLKNSRTG
jgi:hypothetical protein